MNTSTKKITEQEKKQIIQEAQKASERISRLRVSDPKAIGFKDYLLKFEFVLWLLPAIRSLWRYIFH